MPKNANNANNANMNMNMNPSPGEIPMGGEGRSRAGRKNFKGMFLGMMLFLLGTAIWHFRMNSVFSEPFNLKILFFLCILFIQE
jgi:hypothetical protein